MGAVCMRTPLASNSSFEMSSLAPEVCTYGTCEDWEVAELPRRLKPIRLGKGSLKPRVLLSQPARDLVRQISDYCS